MHTYSRYMVMGIGLLSVTLDTRRPTRRSWFEQWIFEAEVDKTIRVVVMERVDPTQTSDLGLVS